VAANSSYELFRTELGTEVLDALIACGAKFVPLVDGDGEDLVGAAMVNGTEVHFVAHPLWRGGKLGSRRVIRGFLSSLLRDSELGFLTTRVLTAHKDAQRFVQRVGFKPVWNDGTCQFFMLHELPFPRTSQ
jgi:GNAT superfamily N-acetyltransferase